MRAISQDPDEVEEHENIDAMKKVYTDVEASVEVSPDSTVEPVVIIDGEHVRGEIIKIVDRSFKLYDASLRRSVTGAFEDVSYDKVTLVVFDNVQHVIVRLGDCMEPKIE